MTFFLFPGQGSQAPGMGRDFYEQCAESRAVLDQCGAIVGNGFLDTLFTGSDDEVKELLWKQLDSPVLWTDVMRTAGPVDAIEAGPGRTLQGLAKRMEGAPSVQTAGTIESVDALRAAAV